jgi:hypothetical protein
VNGIMAQGGADLGFCVESAVDDIDGWSIWRQQGPLATKMSH